MAEQPAKDTNKSTTTTTTTTTKDDEIATTLMDIYDEMRNRQRKAILSQGCMRPDPYFAKNPARLDDDRRCLAISCIMDDEHLNGSGNAAVWTDAYYTLQTRLKELCSTSSGTNHIRFDTKVGNGIYGQLHWTLMQLVGFADYNNNNNEEEELYNTTSYLDCVQSALMKGGMDTAIEIQYVGCIAVSSGLLMIGIPTCINANTARDCVRTSLQQEGYPLKEPFVNDIVHSTLFRVTNDDNDTELYQKILDIANDYESIPLGTVTLSQFQIGPASWRMLPSEVQDTPPWRKWTVPL